MTTNHTPGPWSAAVVVFDEDIPKGLHAAICTPNGGIACLLSHLDDLDAAGKANARLIAAAPDMLDALMHLAAEVRSLGLLDVKKRFSLVVYHAAAEKAIHKATIGD